MLPIWPFMENIGQEELRPPPHLLWASQLVHLHLQCRCTIPFPRTGRKLYVIFQPVRERWGQHLRSCFSTTPWFPTQPQWHIGQAWELFEQAPGSLRARAQAGSSMLWPCCLHPACPHSPCMQRGGSSWKHLPVCPKIPSHYSKGIKGTWSKAQNISSVSEAVKNISDKGTYMHSWAPVNTFLFLMLILYCSWSRAWFFSLWKENFNSGPIH